MNAFFGYFIRFSLAVSVPLTFQRIEVIFKHLSLHMDIPGSTWRAGRTLGLLGDNAVTESAT